MDMRTGKMYDSLAAAVAAGVPPSDVAEVHVDLLPENATGRETLLARLKECPEVTFSSGPFKNRAYKRTETGQLVRVR
jgi:hypothetical protein